MPMNNTHTNTTNTVESLRSKDKTGCHSPCLCSMKQNEAFIYFLTDVWFCFSPDTFRVISSDAEKTHPKFESQSYRASFEPETPVERILPDINCGRTRVLPKPTADFRSHNPHPNSCSFIRTDVRLLNDPICTVSWLSCSLLLYWSHSCSTEKLAHCCLSSYD